ncbi:MAG: tripartite tricarboxylate transporter substrate-binding protein, partial [Alphaproteobacteria bacterium]|nr:tripartite tricarboxylate transporter substrate-binding protein [Alphaproteobacteria bacterium]
MKRRQFSLAIAMLPFAERALAQGDDWPSKSVRVVCPFTPGGSQDNIARRLSAKLSDYLGQTFVVDNRTGAGGSIAADNVAKSPADGYSVLLGS